jgi:DNA-binding transcriptional MerR regulator
MRVSGEPTVSARTAAKSPRAFRTIAEVADELDLPQHVLRFWETKFAQIRPIKRRGGRRYYRPEDVQLLRRISGLLYGDGYTIRGVQRLLRHGGGKGEVDDDGTLAADPPASAEAPRPQSALPLEVRDELKAVLDSLERIRIVLEQRHR